MGKKRVALVEGESSKGASDDKAQKKRKKRQKVLARANVYIRASYNNTSITATDENGNVLAWSTAGSAGFKGPRKATPYAANRVADIFTEKMEKYDPQSMHLFVSGIGAGRFSAIRALGSKGFNVVAINDITPVPHNGCRPPKPKRN